MDIKYKYIEDEKYINVDNELLKKCNTDIPLFIDLAKLILSTIILNTKSSNDAVEASVYFKSLREFGCNNKVNLKIFNDVTTFIKNLNDISDNDNIESTDSLLSMLRYTNDSSMINSDNDTRTKISVSYFSKLLLILLTETNNL